MIVITNIFKFRKWFKYGMKSKHPTAARPEWAEALSQGLLWTQASRPEGAEAISPGLLWTQATRPEWAEALSSGLLWKQATRPEGAEALSPGQRPGYNDNQQCAL